MKIHPALSDPFFNTAHDDRGQLYRLHAERKTVPAEADERRSLEGDAKDFIECMEQLGVACPSVDALIDDFLERV